MYSKGKHYLTKKEKDKLVLANKLLTEITEKHNTYCNCLLCEARMYTDVQDEESFHVDYTPCYSGRN